MTHRDGPDVRAAFLVVRTLDAQPFGCNSAETHWGVGKAGLLGEPDFGRYPTESNHISMNSVRRRVLAAGVTVSTITAAAIVAANPSFAATPDTSQTFF